LKLLIHHHDPIFQDEDGRLWGNAGIARWISSLSQYFNEIGLLFFEVTQRSKLQDCQYLGVNIKFHSLGKPGSYRGYFNRRSYIREMCQKVATNYDTLLIRGLTPKQQLIWSNSPLKNKAFLLVRSPRQKRLTNFSLFNVIAAIINSKTERQFIHIAKSNAILMANSPVYIPEIESISGRPAFFAPTSTMLQDEIPPLEFRELNQVLRLLFVGRVGYLKGIRELIEAMALLRDGAGIQSILDVVGPCEEELMKDLTTLAKSKGVDKNIIWHGRINFGSALFKFYQKADIFVLPTYTEGFPRVYWEAAANSCPTILTAVGGIPAILSHGKHSLLIRPKSNNDLAEAIQLVMQDEKTRNHIIFNAHQLASQYSIEQCAKKLVEILYRETGFDSAGTILP
jgi:glycosyltransferase involved in cell wall biosynthesis